MGNNLGVFRGYSNPQFSRQDSIYIAKFKKCKEKRGNKFVKKDFVIFLRIYWFSNTENSILNELKAFWGILAEFWRIFCIYGLAKNFFSRLRANSGGIYQIEVGESESDVSFLIRDLVFKISDIRPLRAWNLEVCADMHILHMSRLALSCWTFLCLNFSIWPIFSISFLWLKFEVYGNSNLSRKS